MVFYKSKIVDSLKRKGFKKERSTKHDFYYLYVNNKKTPIRTQVSQGSDEMIGDTLCNMMGKQLNLASKDFKDLINCPLSKEGYIEKLKEQQAI